MTGASVMMWNGWYISDTATLIPLMDLEYFVDYQFYHLEKLPATLNAYYLKYPTYLINIRMRFIYSKLSSVLIKYSKVATIRLKPDKTILLCY